MENFNILYVIVPVVIFIIIGIRRTNGRNNDPYNHYLLDLAFDAAMEGSNSGPGVACEKLDDEISLLMLREGKVDTLNRIIHISTMAPYYGLGGLDKKLGSKTQSFLRSRYF